MDFNNTPNRRLILGDEEIWISRSMTVLAVLIFRVGEQRYVPLGIRGKALAYEVGKWGLPGGYVDYGETVGEALIREVWEEIGLNLPELQGLHRWVGNLEQPYSVASAPRGQQNITLRFGLTFFDRPGTPLPPLTPQVGPEEVEQAGWFPLQEALAMELAFNHQAVIKDYLDHDSEDNNKGDRFLT
ncbi:MAG: NUDIX hydrolase [Synechococcales cyanobacterium CRU_2_2]|nr:NUDIX hydrolase [Synechococcales cyanobacterium CRU_2_2]